MKTAKTADKITITDYHHTHADELMVLLMELHCHYFKENAEAQHRELREEKNMEKAYRKYVNEIHASKNDTWKIYLAKNAEAKVIGFIIGSVEVDASLVKGHIGKLEDWLVLKDSRGQGTGMLLYKSLEKWFVKKGCDQVVSDTWHGNHLSVKAHQQSGFFVSGISFSKKLK